MNWHEHPYIDKNKYILYNLEKLKLTKTQALICLLINFYGEIKQELTYEMIADKLSIDVSKIDECIDELVAMGYLNIKVNGRIAYDLDGIFQERQDDDQTFKELLNAFETVFNRVLNTTELSILSELIDNYPKDKIIWALKEAEVYQNGMPNMYYVKSVLDNEQKSK